MHYNATSIFFVCFLHLLKEKEIYILKYIFKVQHNQVCSHKIVTVFGKKSSPWSSQSLLAHLILPLEVDIVGTV